MGELDLLHLDAGDGAQAAGDLAGDVGGADELEDDDAAGRADVAGDVVQADARLDVAAELGEDLLHRGGVLQAVGDVHGEDLVGVGHVLRSFRGVGGGVPSGEPWRRAPSVGL